MQADEQEMDYSNVPVPMESAPMQHGTEGSIKFQLTFDDIIDEIEHVLRCEIPIADQETGEVSWVVDPEGQPLINKKGMSRVRTMLRSKLSRNIPLSDLDDEEIRNIAKMVEFNIIDTLEDNWEAFGVPDTSAATTIKQSVGTQVFALLKRSKFGATLRHLRSTHHTSEIQQMTARPQNQTVNNQRVPLLAKMFGGRRY